MEGMGPQKSGNLILLKNIKGAKSHRIFLEDEVIFFKYIPLSYERGFFV